jgi:hypothetical protein
MPSTAPITAANCNFARSRLVITANLPAPNIAARAGGIRRPLSSCWPPENNYQNLFDVWAGEANCHNSALPHIGFFARALSTVTPPQPLISFWNFLAQRG